MSNYAYIVTKREKPLSDSFISKFSNESYIVSSKVDDYYIYFFSRKSKICRNELGYFKGFYIDHNKKYVGFSHYTSTTTDYLEGCFININEDIENRLITINADVFGIMPMLYSKDESTIIISDSLYFIKKIRDDLGFSNTLDYNNFISRTYLSVMTSTPLSSSTLVSEIKYALPGSIFNIQIRDKPILNVIHQGAKNIFALEAMSYEDGIRDAAAQMCELLGGIIESKTLPCLFDLSGGLDSRLLLAGASNYLGNNSVSVASQLNKKRDYSIASEICDKFNIKLNIKDKSVNRKINQGSMWLASNAGIYDSLFAVKADRSDNFRFKIGGHGAEVFKGNYGWKTVRSLGDNFENKDVKNIFLNEIVKGIEEFGIDRNDPMGSEWHFLAYRNAIHSSKGLQSTDYYLRPLLIKPFVHNMKINANRDMFKNNPVSDMLIYLNPKLAAVKFDDKRKNLSQDDISNVISRLGVYGNHGSLYHVEQDAYTKAEANGYMVEVLEMAATDGFKDTIDLKNFLSYIDNSVLKKDELTNYSINRLFSYITGLNGTPVHPGIQKIAISKLLSLNVLK